MCWGFGGRSGGILDVLNFVAVTDKFLAGCWDFMGI
jgi:hypothetical protein